MIRCSERTASRVSIYTRPTAISPANSKASVHLQVVSLKKARAVGDACNRSEVAWLSLVSRPRQYLGEHQTSAVVSA